MSTDCFPDLTEILSSLSCGFAWNLLIVGGVYDSEKELTRKLKVIALILASNFTWSLTFNTKIWET